MSTFATTLIISVVLAFTTLGLYQDPRKSHWGRDGDHKRRFNGADCQKPYWWSSMWSTSSMFYHLFNVFNLKLNNKCICYQQNEAAKEFDERHKQDVEKVKELDLEE